MMGSNNHTSSILTTQKLGDFFFEKLSTLNNKSLCPVPAELIFYSSKILEENFHSNTFFEMSEGKTKNKILGLKLLEAQTKPALEKQKILKEVGDTSLILSGYFHDSLSDKLNDEKYYFEIGKRAYLELDNYIQDIFEIKYFYKYIATGFEILSRLLNLLHQENKGDPYKHLLIGDASEKDYLTSGAMALETKKVS